MTQTWVKLIACITIMAALAVTGCQTNSGMIGWGCQGVAEKYAARHQAYGDNVYWVSYVETNRTGGLRFVKGGILCHAVNYRELPNGSREYIDAGDSIPRVVPAPEYILLDSKRDMDIIEMIKGER